MFTIARALRAPLGTIQIDSAFPPSEVLENLRARGREWRESEVPQDLRGKAQTLDVKIEGVRFEIHWIGGGNPFFKPLCFGTVQPYGDGSRIRAGFKLSPRELRLFGFYASGVIVTILPFTAPSTLKWVSSATLAIYLIFIALRRRDPEAMRVRLIETLASAARGTTMENGSSASARKDEAHRSTLR